MALVRLKVCFNINSVIVEHYKADIAHQSWKDRLADHEEVLARKLCEFLDSRIMYSLRRLPPSELEQIYIGPTDEGMSLYERVGLNMWEGIVCLLCVPVTES